MITLHDVAKEAGVSSSTVSIVVNDRKVRGVSISSATRERVLSVARRMGYTPNSLARAVVTGKNRVFGFIKEEFLSELAMRVMVGAQEEAEKQDYLIKPFLLSQPLFAEEVAHKCIGQRVAGIIVVNLPDSVFEAVFREADIAGVPVVTVDSPSSNAPCIQITSDAEQGVRLVCDHLFELGHRRIGFIGGPADSIVSLERKHLFRIACSEHGIDVPDEHVIDTSWGDNEPVTEGVLKILSGPVPTRPTALFCAGDPIAMMTIRAARKFGLTLPQDLTVVGYSNASYAYLADPSLTTVAQDFVEMGRIAVRHLLSVESVEEKLSNRLLIKVPTQLMVRESSWGPSSL